MNCNDSHKRKLYQIPEYNSECYIEHGSWKVNTNLRRQKKRLAMIYEHLRFMAKVFIIISINTKANKGFKNHSVISFEKRIVHRTISSAKSLELRHFFIHLKHFSWCHFYGFVMFGQSLSMRSMIHKLRTWICQFKYDERQLVNFFLFAFLFTFALTIEIFANICL